MADILIFGMEMPTDEPLRIVLNPNGQLFVDHGVTFTEYEAVELPEHGDLIDASKLIPIYEEMKWSDDYCKECMKGAIWEVEQAPVVILSNIDYLWENRKELGKK